MKVSDCEGVSQDYCLPLSSELIPIRILINDINDFVPELYEIGQNHEVKENTPSGVEVFEGKKKSSIILYKK